MQELKPLIQINLELGIFIDNLLFHRLELNSSVPKTGCSFKLHPVFKLKYFSSTPIEGLNRRFKNASTCFNFSFLTAYRVQKKK